TRSRSMRRSLPRDLLLIADSGPLIGLAGVDCLRLLPRLYRRVGAPPAVLAEILAARDPRVGRNLLRPAPWLEHLPVPASPLSATLRLGRGEMEAIALALQEAGSLLLLDDRTARRVAEAHGVPVTGSAGVLVRARRENLIREVRPILLAMRANG